MKQIFKPEIWTVKRKKFNPYEWLSKPTVKAAPKPFAIHRSELSKFAEVEIVVQRIETSKIDLTRDYSDWIKMGFAFSSEFNEMGRDFFHRISRFHPDYNFTKCNLQFDNCLKGFKSGITLKSFFGSACDAGINIKV